MNGGRLSVSTKHIAKEEKSGIRIISTIKKYWFIYLLAIPGFIFLVFFSYGPMYGIVLAFKDYKMNLGVLGSPWVGLAHYRELLSDPSFIQAFKNTIRFLYKGIIIKHNKTEPTYTKTSLFLCEKRRFFMARTEKGVVTTI